MHKLKCVSILAFCLSAISCWADKPASAPTQVEQIDVELQSLNEQMHQLRLRHMQEEINSQPLMLDNAGEFVTHIKAAESYENQADILQERINRLEAQKKQLQKDDANTPMHQ